jgi:hypothetical protein
MVEKLETLFYLLIRDKMPAGELIKFVELVKDIDQEIKFTNKHIIGLAKDLVERLK